MLNCGFVSLVNSVVVGFSFYFDFICLVRFKIWLVNVVYFD